jgi:hypothetical protein
LEGGAPLIGIDMKKTHMQPDWANELATATQAPQGDRHASGSTSASAGPIEFSDPVAVRDEICRNHPFGELFCYEGIVEVCAAGRGETLLQSMFSTTYLPQFESQQLNGSEACSPNLKRQLQEVTGSEVNDDPGHGYQQWEFDETDLINTLIYARILRETADVEDGAFDWADDEFAVGGMERIRLRFVAIDDVEALALEFLCGEWWDRIELRDELRRACSGAGECSKYLARRMDFEFLTGHLERLANRATGPLSTPVAFSSTYPEPPTWNKDPVLLSGPSARGAATLHGCVSYMMH